MDELLRLTSQAEADHFWFRGFRQFVTPLLDRAAAGRTGLSLLDCGCGTGGNLRELARHGRAVGIDLTTTGLVRAKAAGVSVARADVTRLPFGAAQFDLVTSFDMLQCVPDDATALTEIARVLKRGGSFVGSVAAFDVLHGDHSILSEEVRRYRRRRLTELLHGAGLKPEVIRYAFASLFPMLLVVRTLQRLRGARATGSEIAVPSPPINWVLTRIVAAEASLAPRVAMPFGSSIVFVARKI